MTTNEAQRAFITAANQAAHTHNVFTAAERAEFDASTKFADLTDAEGWARLVVVELSTRCRSFTPPVLANLTSLCKAVDAAEVA